MARNSNTEHLKNLQAHFKDLETKYKSEVDKNKNLTEEIQALQEAMDRDYEEYEEDQQYSNGDSEEELPPQGQLQTHPSGPSNGGLQQDLQVQKQGQQQ